MHVYPCQPLLKRFYFTAFGAQLSKEQVTKRMVNGVLPLSVYMFSPSFPCVRQNVTNALAFANETHSKAKNADSDESIVKSSQSNATANDGDGTAQPLMCTTNESDSSQVPVMKPEKRNMKRMKNHVSPW